MGLSEDEIFALQLDIQSSPFSEKDRTLLKLAESLTLDPMIAAPATRSALSAGWSEAEVAQAVFIVSYFNMVTRIAQAFALPPDDGHQFNPDASLPMLPGAAD